jgi:hypothetical protein
MYIGTEREWEVFCFWFAKERLLWKGLLHRLFWPARPIICACVFGHRDADLRQREWNMLTVKKNRVILYSENLYIL